MTITILLSAVAGLASWSSLAKPEQTRCRVAVVPDMPQCSEAALRALVKRLTAEKVLAVVPSDLSETTAQIEAGNKIEASGALTVGRIGQDSGVMGREETRRTPFNRRNRVVVRCLPGSRLQQAAELEDFPLTGRRDDETYFVTIPTSVLVLRRVRGSSQWGKPVLTLFANHECGHGHRDTHVRRLGN